ncbi:MAG: helix-turn-helix domain-containing protein [Paracoccaceae bacterium]|nr:helix-turn-helix domain-containing protein [Paracoccaceae bacterium]
MPGIGSGRGGRRASECAGGGAGTRVADSTLYRWVNAGILPSVRPDVPGAPVRIRMGADFRSWFRLDPPEGFVPLREAMRCLGVSRQTVWQRAAFGGWNPVM